MTEEEGKPEKEEEEGDWEAYKAFVGAILAVPKEEIDRREAEREKRRKPDSS